MYTTQNMMRVKDIISRMDHVKYRDNFTKELQENNHFMVIFLQVLSKIPW